MLEQCHVNAVCKCVQFVRLCRPRPIGLQRGRLKLLLLHQLGCALVCFAGLAWTALRDREKRSWNAPSSYNMFGHVWTTHTAVHKSLRNWSVCRCSPIKVILAILILFWLIWDLSVSVDRMWTARQRWMSLQLFRHFWLFRHECWPGF